MFQCSKEKVNGDEWDTIREKKISEKVRGDADGDGAQSLEMRKDPHPQTHTQTQQRQARKTRQLPTNHAEFKNLRGSPSGSSFL